MSALSDMMSMNDLLSSLSSNNKEPINIKDLDSKNTSLLRCPVCYRASRIFCDFLKHNYYTICDSHHKNEHDTFESFLENSNKDIADILCNKCQKSEEDFSKMFICIDCNLFFCSECKIQHNEEIKHNKFISLDKFDNYCEKHDMPFNSYDNEQKTNICEKCYEEGVRKNPSYKKNIIAINKYNNYEDTINDNYKKALENIKMWENASRLFNEWLENLVNKCNEFINSIYNYCSLQYKIVSYLNNNNNYEKYKNNFNVYFNYETINNEKIDNYIRYLNNHLNKNYNKKDNLYMMSQFFLNVLDDYDKRNLDVESKKSLTIQTGKNNNALPKLFSDKYLDDENKTKVEYMKPLQYEFKSKVETLIPFNDGKYLILGLNSGKIGLYEEKKKIVEIENEKNDDEEEKENCWYLFQKLLIEEFKNPIKNLCAIDKDKIVASDKTNIIKIIQFESNFAKYKVAKNLELLDNSGNINIICNLPIYSYYRNRNFFCIGDSNNILIYQSNKMPKDLKPPGLYYKEKEEDFTIVQPTLMNIDFNNKDIKDNKDYYKPSSSNNEELNFNLEKSINLKTSVNCIIEVNEKYMAATCNQEKKIIIYHTQNGFKEVAVISNCAPCEGNSIMEVTSDRKKLFVGCMEGICQINVDNLKKNNKYHLGQSITYLGIYNYNTNNIITCISLKNENFFIKQYKKNTDSKGIGKYSEIKLNNSKEIIDFKIIGDKIYFIDEHKNIRYYQQQKK